MTRLIQSSYGEGEIFNRWMHSRLIENNKNVLSAELGGTGSGKSYRDLRKAELWYKYHFNEPFPSENICFSIPEVVNLLKGGNLRKGEIIIFEEAGTSLGSLDFATKLSKMFTYVLQSFRSMNIAIFMNLPYLSMLNKQARMLLHFSSESDGINFSDKKNVCKPKFHQVSQSTGKIYQKYLRVKNKKGKMVRVKRFSYSMPSEYLIDAYEERKRDFLFNLTTEFSNKMAEQDIKDGKTVDNEHLIKLLTEKQLEAYNLYWKHQNLHDISKILGISQAAISQRLQKAKRLGLLKGIKEKPLENPLI